MSCTRLGIKRVVILAVPIVLLLSVSFCDARVVCTPNGVELRGIGAPVGYCYVNALTADETPQPLKNAFSIKQVAASPPHLDSLDPTSGPMGTDVALSGEHFGTSQGDSYVTFSGIEAHSYHSWSNGKIVCKVPAGATSGPVQVTAPGGTSNKREFTVWEPKEPKILDVSPKSIHPGDAGVNIHILGEFTHFEQGASTAIFSGTGIRVNSTEVADFTHVTANISVDMNAATGFRDVNVKTLSEAPEPLTNHFIVIAKPVVDTTEVSSIAVRSASSGGDVTSDGAVPVTARGVCWSTSPSPTISSSHTIDGSGTGSFTSTIKGLIPRTTYHVRAYATNNVGTGYGSDISFITSYIMYVSKDGKCVGRIPCYTSIQEAINAANTRAVIWIAQGTYTESITLSIPISLTLKGGWDSAFSIQTPNTTFIKAPKSPQGSLTLQMVTIKP